MLTITPKNTTDLIQKYLQELDWQVKENANMGYSLQGMRNYISNEVTKDFWLSKIYPKEISDSHIDGDLHIHDLGELNSYCVGWDLMDLLITGFKGVEGKVACNPAKHFSSALGQIVNFIFTTQGETAGAQAFSNFDTLLAPFVRYDKLDYKTVKQEIQSFVFNMNVATRVGFQTPFSNLTMDLNPPKYLKDQAVIIGGQPQAEKYKDFQLEMDMINQAFAEVMLEGDSDGRVFTFPIPTYNITKEFDWDDDRVEAIWWMTAKYGIPYFANFINSDMNPDDARSMCCRLRLDNRQLRKRGGGLFGSNPLTGSIGVVTINLPRIGYLSKDIQEFYQRLEKLMILAKESLVIKREIIEKYTEEGLYPYTKFYLRSVKQKFGKYWSNHFSTIGLVGLNEALLNFNGEDLTSKKGQEMGNQILQFMRDKIFEFQEETKEMFNLEATPAEGTAYRLAKLDQMKFNSQAQSELALTNLRGYNSNKAKKLIFGNQVAVEESGAEPYYTNSSQLPVYFTEDIFTALDLQDELQSKYTGGTVLHGFLGEKINDIATVKKLVKTIATNYKLPYFTLTPTFSICPKHGYISGEHDNCPKCQSECEVYSRVVGYIRPVKQWNKGKQQEFADRLEYKVTE
jgi:ribonucleoside-triphosphate reductase